MSIGEETYTNIGGLAIKVIGKQNFSANTENGEGTSQGPGTPATGQAMGEEAEISGAIRPQDINLAAGRQQKIPHSRVNDFVRDNLPQDLRESPLNIRNYKQVEGYGAKARAIPIRGLFSATGQFAHIGLGQVYEEAIIYIDADYAENQIVLMHELYEIAKWEAKRKELGLNPQEMRQWILDNLEEAKRLAEQWHNEAPRLDILFFAASRRMQGLLDFLAEAAGLSGHIAFEVEKTGPSYAFVNLDGKVHIAEGLFDLVQNGIITDGEFAAILAHEIAHLVADDVLRYVLRTLGLENLEEKDLELARWIQAAEILTKAGLSYEDVISFAKKVKAGALVDLVAQMHLDFGEKHTTPDQLINAILKHQIWPVQTMDIRFMEAFLEDYLYYYGEDRDLNLGAGREVNSDRKGLTNSIKNMQLEILYRNDVVDAEIKFLIRTDDSERELADREVARWLDSLEIIGAQYLYNYPERGSEAIIYKCKNARGGWSAIDILVIVSGGKVVSVSFSTMGVIKNAEYFRFSDNLANLITERLRGYENIQEGTSGLVVVGPWIGNNEDRVYFERALDSNSLIRDFILFWLSKGFAPRITNQYFLTKFFMGAIAQRNFISRGMLRSDDLEGFVHEFIHLIFEERLSKGQQEEVDEYFKKSHPELLKLFELEAYKGQDTAIGTEGLAYYLTMALRGQQTNGFEDFGLILKDEDLDFFVLIGLITEEMRADIKRKQEDLERARVKAQLFHFEALALKGERNSFTESDAEGEKGKRTERILVPGVNIKNVQGEDVFEMTQSELSELADALQLSEEALGALIRKAFSMLERAGISTDSIRDAKILIALLEENASEHLFEDHRENNLIGINRTFLEIARNNPKLAQILFTVGLAHELRHEAGMTEENLLLDARLFAELIKEQGLDIDEVRTILQPYLADTEFIDAVKENLTKVALEDLGVDRQAVTGPDVDQLFGNEEFQRKLEDIIEASTIFGVESGFALQEDNEFGEVKIGFQNGVRDIKSKYGNTQFHPLTHPAVVVFLPGESDLLYLNSGAPVILVWGDEIYGFFATVIVMKDGVLDLFTEGGRTYNDLITELDALNAIRFFRLNSTETKRFTFDEISSDEAKKAYTVLQGGLELIRNATAEREKREIERTYRIYKGKPLEEIDEAIEECRLGLSAIEEILNKESLVLAGYVKEDYEKKTRSLKYRLQGLEKARVKDKAYYKYWCQISLLNVSDPQRLPAIYKFLNIILGDFENFARNGTISRNNIINLASNPSYGAYSKTLEEVLDKDFYSKEELEMLIQKLVPTLASQQFVTEEGAKIRVFSGEIVVKPVAGINWEKEGNYIPENPQDGPEYLILRLNSDEISRIGQTGVDELRAKYNGWFKNFDTDTPFAFVRVYRLGHRLIVTEIQEAVYRNLPAASRSRLVNWEELMLLALEDYAAAQGGIREVWIRPAEQTMKSWGISEAGRPNIQRVYGTVPSRLGYMLEATELPAELEEFKQQYPYSYNLASAVEAQSFLVKQLNLSDKRLGLFRQMVSLIEDESATALNSFRDRMNAGVTTHMTLMFGESAPERNDERRFRAMAHRNIECAIDNVLPVVNPNGNDLTVYYPAAGFDIAIVLASTDATTLVYTDLTRDFMEQGRIDNFAAIIKEIESVKGEIISQYIPPLGREGRCEIKFKLPSKDGRLKERTLIYYSGVDAGEFIPQEIDKGYDVLWVANSDMFMSLPQIHEKLFRLIKENGFAIFGNGGASESEEYRTAEQMFSHIPGLQFDGRWRFVDINESQEGFILGKKNSKAVNALGAMPDDKVPNRELIPSFSQRNTSQSSI
ncbi:MAG: M48 family metalloprotease [Candidatus Omnitrophota bacterium]|nr:M48 family metalloprotease [Candidatus Omnitrophota bacterium]